MLQDNDLLEISHKQRDIQDLANFLSNRIVGNLSSLYPSKLSDFKSLCYFFHQKIEHF